MYSNNGIGGGGHTPIKPTNSFNSRLNNSYGYSPGGINNSMMGGGALMPYGGDPYVGGHYM